MSSKTRFVMRDPGLEESLNLEFALTRNLLAILDMPVDFRTHMQRLTMSLQAWSGCEAVGIRLEQDDDFPYFETRGFPSEHLRFETSLCVRLTDGSPVRDGAGLVVLECMCGNIIRGHFDPSLPFFSANGSFWTNSTTKLLAETTEEDRQSRTRNRCNREGYESVALVPLRSRNRTFGLLQFNDRRPDRFSPEFIARVERLADNLAIAVKTLKDGEERARSLAEKELLLREVHHRMKNSIAVISSIIALEAERATDGLVKGTLQGIGVRVQSIATLYEDLNRSDSYEGLDALSFLPALVGRCISQFPAVPSVLVETSVEKIFIPANLLQPLGLIVAELLTNIMKYAFVGRSEGLVSVSACRKGARAIVSVSDDGIGMPETLDIGKSSGLGLMLIHGLVGQMNGDIRIERGTGTTVVLEFPL